METAVITPQNMPYTPIITKQNKPLSRAEKRQLGDEHAISLIEEGLKGEFISEEEFLQFLRQ